MHHDTFFESFLLTFFDVVIVLFAILMATVAADSAGTENQDDHN